jgi:N-acetylglucosamine-6-sulfatase
VKRLLLVIAGLGTALVSVVLMLLSTNGFLSENQGAKAQTTSRPNIVFIMTDDLDELAMEQLGGIRSIMNANGVNFENAYVTYSLCCPSRATFFRGQYPHNHGVIGIDTATPPSGDVKWRELGRDQNTVATWLNDAGYQTKYIGKYMNGYRDLYKPPGWDEWFVLQGDGIDDGDIINNRMNDNGTSVTLTDHSTDVFANEATDFIRRSSANPEPFFVMVGTKAPHDPPEVADRYQDEFATTPLPRPPNFDEPDVTDKPAWVQSYPRLSPSVIDNNTAKYQQALRSMLSVEDLLEQTIAALQDTGELGNTYIFFTSDNGTHRGQHRIPFGKKTAYEDDIGVPLMVRGPGVPAGAVRDQLVINNDFAPTIAELAGVNMPTFVDGKSFAPLLSSSPPSSWRTAFLEESWKEEGGTNAIVPTHKSIHTQDHILIEYNTGEKELYDLSADPYQLQSKPRTGNEQLYSSLQSRLNALRACSGEGCRSAEWATTTPTDTTSPRVTSTSPTNNATGVAPSANITATFSEKMMASSINPTTFKLLKVNPDGSTTQVTNVSVTPSTDGLRATLNPFGTSTTTHLTRGTKYKAVVSTGAKDLVGNRLDQISSTTSLDQKTWSFTVS